MFKYMDIGVLIRNISLLIACKLLYHWTQYQYITHAVLDLKHIFHCNCIS